VRCKKREGKGQVDLDARALKLRCAQQIRFTEVKEGKKENPKKGPQGVLGRFQTNSLRRLLVGAT
jgi:hypothetical protein